MRGRIKASFRRIVIKGYKYVAIVAYLLMMMHVLLLILGCPMKFAEQSVSMSPVVTLFAVSLSWLLGYCPVHRVCLLYTGVVSRCIDFQLYGQGFGNMLHFARFTMLVVGIVIGIILLAKKIDCIYD